MKRCLVLLVLLVLLCAGCSSVFNPYSGNFQCPETDLGKCVPLGQAYQESVRSNREEVQAPQQQDFEAAYLQDKMALLRELISEPDPPIVKPPQVIRVLILSYVGSGNELYGWRYVYFFADEPSWILDAAPRGR
ncbi:MAG: TraV family lipoprotein [Thermofilaceae archaeon]